MTKQIPIWALALLVVCIGVMNAVAEYWHLYFLVWWLDIPMHLLGGFWVGLTILTYFFAHQKNFPPKTQLRSVVYLALFGAFIIGVGWEFFEWSVDQLSGLTHFDLVDTLADVCNGLIGAAVGSALFVWRGYNKVT